MTLGDFIAHKLIARLVFLLAVLVAAVITSSLGGSPLLGGVLGGVLGLVALSRIRSPGESGDPGIPSEPRRGRQPFRWRIASSPGVSVPEAAGRLGELGMEPDGRGEAWARFSAGSQVRTRLLGGYFVDPARLPISVTLTERPSGGVEASVEDSIGPIAVRDRALEARYALRVAQIRDAIDGARGTVGPLKTAGSAGSAGS